MSWQAALVRWVIRRKMRRGEPGDGALFGLKAASGMETTVAVRKIRNALDKSVASLPGPVRGTTIKQIDTGKFRGEWIIAPKVPMDTKRVIFYCHGGGYFWGNLSAPRNMLARLSGLTSARVFSLDYRLAPEDPFPAAFDDARAAYVWLMEDQRVDCRQLAVGGDSAGGGLALSLLAALHEHNQPSPGAAFLFSPWTDLTISGSSINANSNYDPVITGADLRWAARVYLKGADDKGGMASPLYSKLSDLPPILIQVGSTEILLDDARRLTDAVRRLNGPCHLEIWPNMHHVWQLHSFFLPEGRRALASVANFIGEALPVETNP